MSGLQLISIISAGICFILSLILRKHFGKLNGLQIILGVSVIGDLTGILITNVLDRDQMLQFNLPYYNVLTSVIILLYLILYLNNLDYGLLKTIFKICIVGYIVFYFINISFIQDFSTTLHTYSFTFGSFVLCFGIALYIKQLIESEKVIALNEDPLFWISIGVFSFYIINIPYMAMYNFMYSHYFDLLVFLRKLTIYLGILMYICIFIGLKCLKRKSSSASSSEVL